MMEYVSRANAVHVSEIPRLFREWIAASSESDMIIGPGKEDRHGRNKWVHCRDGDRLFGFDPDTTRESIKDFLQLAEVHGDEMEWKVVESAEGNLSAVGFGPVAERPVRTLYVYFMGISKPRRSKAMA